MPEIKTAEEILTDEKIVLFDADIVESKARQQRAIASANSGIDYANGQIAKHTQSKEKAQKLLDELEARYPTVEVL